MISLVRFGWPFFPSFTFMTLLPKSGDRDVFKLAFHCWRQFSFNRNVEKFSVKNLISLLFKCNLLSFKCLVGSILLSCERNEIFLSVHIGIRQWFTSFALLFNSSSLEHRQAQIQCYCHFSKMLLDLLLLF